MNAQPIPTIANHKHPAYSSPVATLLATGFGDSNTTRRTSAHHPKAGAFFVPVASSYGGCAWDTFGYAGFRVSRFANLRTAATQYRLATIRGSSTTHGAPPMNHIHTALKNRAAAHKAMAFAALRADSSASVRLGRYRKHIDRSRTLLALADVVGGAV